MVLRGALALAFVGLLACACSSNDSSSSGTSTSCNDDPSTCKAGTVCWLDDLAKGTFSCEPAMSGAAQGTACQNIVGHPTCDVGLGCFPTSTTSADGVCEPFCSLTKPEPGQCATPASGGQCYTLTPSNASEKHSIQICNAPAPTTDGGTDGAAGASGAGGTGGSAGASGSAGAGGSDAGSDAATD